MKIKKNLINNLLCILSLIGLVLVHFEFLWFNYSNEKPAYDLNIWYINIIIIGITVIVIFLSDTAKYERIAIIIQMLCLIMFNLYFNVSIFSQIIVLIIVLARIAVSERWPVSGYIILSLLICIILSESTNNTRIYYNLFASITFIKVIIGLIVSSVLISMTIYRESLIEAQKEIKRVQEALNQLTKSNLEYQDYAFDIEESARENERNRVTRDVHDVVGYTLTNTIMLMEAASDMMRRNPLGVTSLINTARENAQEGLEETRRALYRLREKQTDRPKGFFAVSRMIKIFSAAKSVDIDIYWNNVPWKFDEVRDLIIFHTIQQGLINAFIHGKADRIIINSNIVGNTLILTLKDNGLGLGTEPIMEGIGLKGLRERLEKINGRYSIKNIFDGVLLEVFIPLNNESKSNFRSEK